MLVYGQLTLCTVITSVLTQAESAQVLDAAFTTLVTAFPSSLSSSHKSKGDYALQLVAVNTELIQPVCFFIMYVLTIICSNNIYSMFIKILITFQSFKRPEL